MCSSKHTCVVCFAACAAFWEWAAWPQSRGPRRAEETVAVSTPHQHKCIQQIQVAIESRKRMRLQARLVGRVEVGCTDAMAASTIAKLSSNSKFAACFQDANWGAWARGDVR